MLVMLWCVVIAGFLDLSYNSMAMTLVQLNAPSTKRGRVIGLHNMASLGRRAFSGITIGLGGSVVGVHWSLGASAVALFAITLALPSIAMRSRRAEYAPEEQVGTSKQTKYRIQLRALKP